MIESASREALSKAFWWAVVGGTETPSSDRGACNTSTRDARAAGTRYAINAAPVRMAAAPTVGTTPGMPEVPR